MIETMVPILAVGRTERAVELLPDEEFAERLSRLRDELRRRGLTGLVAWGDRREYACVCYLTGLIPREGTAVVVMTLEGDLALFVGVPGTRDLPGVQALTWVPDVALLDDAWPAIERLGRDGLRVGFTVGSRMASSIVRRLRRTPGLVDAEGLVEPLMRIPSDAERSVLRAAAVIARDAAHAIDFAQHGGAGVKAALVEGERFAFRAGAHDVRVMAGPVDRPTMMPSAAWKEDAQEFSYSVAVELHGYWGEALGTIGAERALVDARARLAAVARAVAAGTSKAPEAGHPLLAGGPIVALGLEPRGVGDPAATLADGVYSLRAGSWSQDGSALVSETIAVRHGELERWAS